MAEIVRGQISDRPWGLTFGQFGLREITGQLTVHAADGRDYRVAFEHGAIVGAASPQPADAATRIAMTTGLLSSTQVATVAKQIAATPEIDEIALLASAARLQPEQVAALRRKVICHRAARTFSVEVGSFVVDDVTTIPVAPDAAVDVRAVLLQGARMNLSELRLITELRELGSHFTLGESALEHADWFGITPPELPILEALRGGASLPELEARHREIDPRTVQAVIYALIAGRECQVSTPTVTRAKTTSNEPVSVSFNRKSGEHAIPTSLSATSPAPRAATSPVMDPPIQPRSSTLPPATRSMGEQVQTPAKHTTLPPPSRPGTAAEQEFRGAVGTNTSQSPTRKAYADDSVPIRTPSASIPPPLEPAREGTGPYPRAKSVPPRDKPPSTPPVITPRTISQGNVTVSRTQSGNPIPSRTTSGGIARPRTISGSGSGGTPAPIYSEGSDRVSQSLTDAADAFARGLAALEANEPGAAVAELARASTLNPHEFEYSALLAYAQLLAAPANERGKLADKTRKMMTRASQKSRDPAQALIFLGKLESTLGQDKQAVEHYRAALAAKPGHPQALAEIQAIEEKVIARSGFGLFKKKP